MVLNPAIVEQRYREYLAKKEVAKAETLQLEQQRKAQEAYIKAKVEATRLNEIHTATQDYQCENCDRTIPAGSQYRRANIKVGYGHFEGFHYRQRITHLICNVGGGE
jgi:type II secretory pathway pseudopilin PulG